MFLEVIKAEYLEGYRIRLWFNNQTCKVVDLSDSLKGEVFQPLHDLETFKCFSIKFNTIEWENGADFAPEYLYEIGIEEPHCPYLLPEEQPAVVAEPRMPYGEPLNQQ